MNHRLFTVYDEKAEIFIPPFFVPTDGLAVRAFADCVNSADHQFGKHPHDYTLFFVGTFDDSDASFQIEHKKSLGNGVEFLDPTHVTAFKEFENENRPPIQSNQKG